MSEVFGVFTVISAPLEHEKIFGWSSKPPLEETGSVDLAFKAPLFLEQGATTTACLLVMNVGAVAQHPGGQPQVESAGKLAIAKNQIPQTAGERAVERVVFFRINQTSDRLKTRSVGEQGRRLAKVDLPQQAQLIGARSAKTNIVFALISAAGASPNLRGQDKCHYQQHHHSQNTGSKFHLISFVARADISSCRCCSSIPITAFAQWFATSLRPHYSSSLGWSRHCPLSVNIEPSCLTDHALNVTPNHFVSPSSLLKCLIVKYEQK